MSIFRNDFNQPSTKPKPWKRPWFIPAAVGATALLLGIGIGSSGKPKTVEVVKEVPGPERVVTKTVEVTPKACLTYVDLSEQGFSYAAEAMGYMSDGMHAAAAYNVPGIQAANTKLQSLTPKMNDLSPRSNAAKAECRAAAK